MSIYDKLKNNKEFKENYIPPIENVEFISTGVLTLNLLFSGRLTGGIPIGKFSQMAAPSTLGKSFVGLSTLKNAQKKGMFCIFIDTERAFDDTFATAIGVDISKEKFYLIKEGRLEVVQELLLNILKDLSDEERKNVFILLDSFGGLVTSKTIKDALTGNDVVDMTEQKKKNKFAKLLSHQGTTGLVINHVYDNIGGFGDPQLIPGGKGLYFLSSGIVLGKTKAKAKDSASSEVNGVIVTCETKKSRFGKERSKLKFRIKDKGGLDIFYGLLDDAIEGEFVIKPKMGYYARKHINDDKPLKEKNIYNKDFWGPIFKDTDFKDYLECKYSFKNEQLDVDNVDLDDLN